MSDDIVFSELDASGRPIHGGPGRRLMILCDWAPVAQKAIREAVEKHGRPDEIGHSRLVWLSPKAPWTEVVVHRDAAMVDDLTFPYRCFSHLEGVIQTEIKGAGCLKVHELGWHVVVDRHRGRVSVFSDREAVNLLMIDLVGQVAKGLDPKDAQLALKKGVLEILGGGE